MKGLDNMANDTKRIIIGKPYLDQVGGKTRCCATVQIDNKDTQLLWVEVDSDISKYLAFERADAFIVDLLYYAMINGYDIVSEGEMSEKLHYQLEEYWIPTLSKCIDGYCNIRIDAPLNNSRLSNAGAIGTGISGGVDSFFTLLSHTNRTERDYNITHVTYLIPESVKLKSL